MKKGNFVPITDVTGLSVLQMRTSLCKPHLKSSYPAEMQFLPPTLTEEEIKVSFLICITSLEFLSHILNILLISSNVSFVHSRALQ